VDILLLIKLSKYFPIDIEVFRFMTLYHLFKENNYWHRCQVEDIDLG